MIQTVTKYPVSQLFDIDSVVVYAIPRYQREYTWGKSQWESLFDDVLENNPGYYLGSIICINQFTDALAVHKLEVVDGQQRLTTLSLLFASVYQELKRHESSQDEDQRVELSNLLYNLKRKLVLKKGEDQIRLIPQLQNHNASDYRAVLAEIGIVSEVDILAYAGNRKIFRAYRYFQDRIKQMCNDQDDQLDAVMNFLDRLNQAVLVKIDVASHSDAYTLFESLNNRGMPLTAIDLIKNKLLEKLESIDPGKIDQHSKSWDRLLGYLGNDYATQERFFRQYYNAFVDELKAIYKVSIATRSNLMQIYEKLINHDAKESLQKISKAAKQYSLILSRSQGDDKVKSLEKPFLDLDRIQGAPSYVLMLYLLIHKDNLELTNDQLASIVVFLVLFFVRRNLTDTPPTRDLTRLFMTVIEEISSKQGEAVSQSIKQKLIDVSASDQEFKIKLSGAIYDDNSGVTRFILCALAENTMTRENWVDLWRRESKQFVWTIEHIFPQGGNIPQSWINMIADGDEATAKNVQQSHVHKLGNLTITGYNSTLGNKSFEEKRDRMDTEKKRAVGYKNGLKLNEDLANATTWSAKQIEDRTTKLVNDVIDLFKL